MISSGSCCCLRSVPINCISWLAENRSSGPCDRGRQQKSNLASVAGWNVAFKTNPTPRHRAHREIHDLLRASRLLNEKRALEQLRPSAAILVRPAPRIEPCPGTKPDSMAACELTRTGRPSR